MKWEDGRQNANYKKLRLFQFKHMDCYLIKYLPGCKLPVHTDVVEGYRHYRINILLKGEDCFQGKTIFKLWRFMLFRPDIEPHGTGLITSERLLLSIGRVKK